MPPPTKKASNDSMAKGGDYVVYKVGVYGWRKRCLYFLILLILIMAIVNIALTIWIIRVQDFGLHGMGNLHITKDGLRMDGTAEFTKNLKTKSIHGRTDSPLEVVSRKAVSLSALDAENNVVGQISLDSDQIVLKNKKLFIQNQNGKTLLYADDKKIKMNIENLDITVPGGLNFKNSIQTSSVQSDTNNNLKLESLTRKLQVNAADGIEINSFANDIRFDSLKDTLITSQKGKIVLDAKKIKLKNLQRSNIFDISRAKVYDDISEVCMCKDGTLFLAPADSRNPCKVTDGVCV